jgi:hypothetical protein
MGASVPETGSHPTGQAELHRLMTRICQSCFDPECNHIQCYFETPEPTDEETTSTATFADLLRLHGSQLTDLEPKKRDDGRYQVAA